MADDVLTRDGPVPVPMDYVVPQGGELIPLMVTATIDGTSATSAFYAVVRFIAPSGRVMGTAITPSIAAGASADVTWFRDVALCACSQATADYTADALALGPWAYYTLADTATATYQDTSGHGRTCTYDSAYVTQGGAAILPTSSLPSAILAGPGGASNNHAITSSSNQLYTASVFTLTAWIDTSYAGANDQVIAGLGRLDSSATSLFALWLNAHIPEVRMYDNTLTIHKLDGSAAVNDGHAHMLATSYDGTTLRLYVDGVQVNSAALGVTMNTNQTIPVEIGMQLGGVSPRTFSGDLAQVGYFDTVLSAATIAALYNAGASSAAAVESVLAGDASISVGGTAQNVTLETGSLDQIAAGHATAANWSNNSHKITALTAGAAAGDAAIWDQTPAGIVTAKGDLIVASGSHVAARLGVGSDGSVLTADATQANGVKWVAGGGSGITALDSPAATITVTNPSGPTADVDLPTTGVTAATYGDASHVAQLTVDSRGRITAASSVGITGGSAGVWTLLTSSVLSATAANFDLTSIAGTYTNLVLIMRLATNAAGQTFDRINVTVNADTGNNYGWAFAENGTSSSGGIGNAQAFMQLADAAGGTAEAGAFASYELTFPLYSNTTQWKFMHGTFISDREAGGIWNGTCGGFWRSTAAISRITVKPNTGTLFNIGAAAYLYGF